ncbi:MAG: AsmA family protein [Pseudomonadota bacterium]
MKSLLTLLGLAFFFILSALFIGPHYVDWNSYRDVFELHATNIIGREVKVNGKVHLNILPTPHLEFQNVEIAAAPNTKRTHFLKIEAFKVRLAVPPLLRGVIEAKKLELTRPKFFFHIDETGKGNWATLGQETTPLFPFVPQNVALQSATIEQGEVIITQAAFETPLVLNNFNGEFSAGSLQGPFNFKGIFEFSGEQRELSFATTKQDENSSLQAKALFKIPRTGSTYLLDGKIRGLSSTLAVDGIINSTIPAHLLDLSQSNPSISKSSYQEQDESPKIQLQSKLSATPTRAEFQDIHITFANDQRPQNLKGNAVLDWSKGLSIQSDLKTTWLNVDQIIGERVLKSASSQKIVSPKANNTIIPKNIIVPFADTLTQLQTTLSQAQVNLEITEAKTGGSLFRDFTLDLSHKDNVFVINKLHVELPGRNQLNVSGRLQPEGKELAFSGPVRLRGQRLGALTHWALHKQNNNVAQSAPYVLQGNVFYVPGRFQIENLQGDLNGSTIRGTIDYNFLDKREFVLALDSEKIDLRDIVPQNTTLKSLITDISRLSLLTQDTTQKETSGSWEPTQIADHSNALNARINIRSGLLHLPHLAIRDFVIDGNLNAQELTIKSVSMASDEGLHLRGSGTLQQIDKNPSGNIRFNLKANTKESIAQLMQQLEIDNDPKTLNHVTRYRALSPLQLAFNVNMGTDSQNQADMIIAGTLGSSKVSLNMRHKGALTRFGTRHIDLSGSLRNASAHTLVEQLNFSKPSNISASNKLGTLNILASGIPNQSMETRLRLEAGATQVRYNGTFKVSEGDQFTQGSMSLQSQNAANALGLFGIQHIQEFRNVPFNLALKLENNNHRYDITEIAGRLGRNKISGDIALDIAPKPMKVNARLSINRTSFPALIAYILPTQNPAELQQALAATNITDTQIWPKQPFRTDALKAFQGQVALKFKRLDLTERMAVYKGELQGQFDKNSVKVENLKGQLFGGQFSSQALLSNTSANIKLKGSASLTNADLAQVFQSRRKKAFARGEGDLSLAFAGEGLSPLGLITVLEGNGKISARNGEVFFLSPEALPKAIDSTTQTAGAKTQFDNILANELPRGSFPFQKIETPLSLKGGTLKVAPFLMAQKGVTVKTSASLEMARMRLESISSLRAQSSSRNRDLPAIQLLFSGPMAEFGTLTPQIETETLKRALSVQQVERNVQTLEKLNKRDPEAIQRARQLTDELQQQYRFNPDAQSSGSDILQGGRGQNRHEYNEPTDIRTRDLPPLSDPPSSSGFFVEGNPSVQQNNIEPIRPQAVPQTRERQKTPQKEEAINLDTIFSDTR